VLVYLTGLEFLRLEMMTAQASFVPLSLINNASASNNSVDMDLGYIPLGGETKTFPLINISKIPTGLDAAALMYLNSEQHKSATIAANSSDSDSTGAPEQSSSNSEAEEDTFDPKEPAYLDLQDTQTFSQTSIFGSNPLVSVPGTREVTPYHLGVLPAQFMNPGGAVFNLSLMSSLAQTFQAPPMPPVAVAAVPEMAVPPPPAPIVEREQEAQETLEQPVLSIGSMNHPHACSGLACKYAWKSRGCKEGADCSRCHLCVWTRAGERAAYGTQLATPEKSSQGARSTAGKAARGRNSRGHKA